MQTRKSVSVPAAAFEKIRQEGGIAKVSDATLRALGVVRLYDPVRRSYRLMMADAFGELLARVIAVRKAYAGYIFAHDLNQMRGIMRHADVYSHEDLDRIERYAKTLKKAGIPPVFPEHLYAPSRFVYFATPRGGALTEERDYPSLFPSIDLILQYGGCTYERRCAALAVSVEKIELRTKIGIQPAGPDDITEFRRWAFTDDGRIDPLLALEICAYVEDTFNVPSDARAANIRRHNQAVLAFLETVLRDLPHAPRVFEVWDGNVLVVEERRWYLRFHPVDRERMVLAYLAYFEQQTSRGKRQMKAFQRLFLLFPELAMPTAEKLGMKRYLPKHLWYRQAIETALQTGDFRQVPIRAFSEEPWAGDILLRFGGVFRQRCRDLGASNPGLLYEDASVKLSPHLGVPFHVCVLRPFKAMLDEERLHVMREMSDEVFCTLFMGRNLTTLGVPTSGEQADSSAELAAYFISRRRSLKDSAVKA